MDDRGVPGLHGGVAASSDFYADDFMYDLTKDPHELTNIVGDPAYAQIKEDLRKRLLSWIEEAEHIVPRIVD